MLEGDGGGNGQVGRDRWEGRVSLNRVSPGSERAAVPVDPRPEVTGGRK